MNEIISTQEETISKPKDAIIIEAKQIEENCLFTAKGHYVCAQFWSKFHLWIGIPTVILAAVTGTLIFVKSDKVNITAGVLSILIIVLSAITTFLNPKETASSHLNAGNNYDSLMTKARMFWSIQCKIESSDLVLTEKLRELAEFRDRLNRESPQIPYLAYKKAKKGIEKGETSHTILKKT